MNTFALIKEKNKTRMVTDRDVADKFAMALLLCKENFINEVLTNQDANGLVEKSVINKFGKSKLPFSKSLVLAIYRKIVEDKPRLTCKANSKYVGETDYIIGLINNMEKEITLNSINFDYALKELGEIKVNSDLEDYEIHSCAKCDILSPLKCEKAEYIKKPISKYPFITEGYQIFIVDENEKIHMEKFIVRKCKNCQMNFKQAYLSSRQIDERYPQKKRAMKINRLKQS